MSTVPAGAFWAPGIAKLVPENGATAPLETVARALAICRSAFIGTSEEWICQVTWPSEKVAAPPAMVPRNRANRRARPAPGRPAASGMVVSTAVLAATTSPTTRGITPVEVTLRVVAPTVFTVALTDVPASFRSTTASPAARPPELVTGMSMVPAGTATVADTVARAMLPAPPEKSGATVRETPLAHAPGDVARASNERAGVLSRTSQAAPIDGSTRTTHAAGPPFSKNP